MGRFGVSDAKESELTLSFARLGIREEDLDETFVRSSGPGGQNVNKVSSCVVLVHRPTGVTVRCQRERSQVMNRFFARRLLAERLETMIRGRESAERKRIEKIRRQKRKRSKRAKEKMLHDKKMTARKKATRGRVADGE